MYIFKPDISFQDSFCISLKSIILRKTEKKPHNVKTWFRQPTMNALYSHFRQSNTSISLFSYLEEDT